MRIQWKKVSERGHCLFCGSGLRLFRRMGHSRFCSEEHERAYLAEIAQIGRCGYGLPVYGSSSCGAAGPAPKDGAASALGEPSNARLAASRIAGASQVKSLPG